MAGGADVHDCKYCVQKHQFGTVEKVFSGKRNAVEKRWLWVCSYCGTNYGWDSLVPLTAYPCTSCRWAVGRHYEPVYDMAKL